MVDDSRPQNPTIIGSVKRKLEEKFKDIIPNNEGLDQEGNENKKVKYKNSPSIDLRVKKDKVQVDTESGEVRTKKNPDPHYTREQAEGIVSGWVEDQFPADEPENAEKQELVKFTINSYFKDKSLNDLARFINSDASDRKKGKLKEKISEFAETIKDQKDFVTDPQIQEFFQQYSLPEDVDKLGVTVQTASSIFSNDRDKFKNSLAVSEGSDQQKYQFAKMVANCGEVLNKASDKEREKVLKALKGSLDPDNPVPITEKDNKLFKDILEREPSEDQEETQSRWQRSLGLGIQGVTRTLSVPIVVPMNTLTDITGTLKQWCNGQSNTLIEVFHFFATGIHSSVTSMVKGLDNLENMIIGKFSTEEEQEQDRRADESSPLIKALDVEDQRKAKEIRDKHSKSVKQQNYEIHENQREAIETNDLGIADDSIGISSGSQGR